MINFRRVFRIVRMLFRTFRRYHWRFLLMIALGLAAGVFGGIGITAVIPLFSMFTASDAPAVTDSITRFITALFSFLHLPLTPAALMGFIVVLFIAKAAIQFFSKYMTDRNMLEFSELMQRS